MGKDEDPVPAVGSADSRSRNKHRLDGISETLKVSADSFDGEGLAHGVLVNIVTLSEQSGTASQVSAYPSFDHSGDSSNIFTDNPSGPDFVNNAEHFRPEVTLVLSPPPFSGIGERLAGESTGEDIDPSSPFLETCFRDIFVRFAFREPVVQHGPAERVDLAVERVLPTHHLGCHLRTADTAEQATVNHPCNHF